MCVISLMLISIYQLVQSSWIINSYSNEQHIPFNFFMLLMIAHKPLFLNRIMIRRS